jgi:hypothetical protein
MPLLAEHHLSTLVLTLAIAAIWACWVRAARGEHPQNIGREPLCLGLWHSSIHAYGVILLLLLLWVTGSHNFCLTQLPCHVRPTAVTPLSPLQSVV